MHQLDERILEHLADDGWASPRTMTRHFRFTASEDRIEERCSELRDAGPLAPIYRDAPMYELTTLGYLYLAGELEAKSLPRRRTVG
jgi:hypothetical protein